MHLPKKLLGHIISGYIDDLYLQGKTQQKCIANVIDAITLFENLGLIIHPDKSVIVPQQRLVFLGYVIDPVYMTVRLTSDKITKIKTLLPCLFQHPILSKTVMLPKLLVT